MVLRLSKPKNIEGGLGALTNVKCQNLGAKDVFSTWLCLAMFHREYKAVVCNRLSIAFFKNTAQPWQLMELRLMAHCYAIGFAYTIYWGTRSYLGHYWLCMLSNYR